MRYNAVMKRNPMILLFALCALLLIGCSSGNAVYTRESFATDSPFMLKVDGQVATACESARRALLGQGYLIDSATADKVKGRRAYKSEDNLSTFVEMNVVCVSESNGSTLYANAVLSTYDLKKSSSSASVGVSAVGSISLPFGRSADSLVKISEETIDDKKYYTRFFAAVDHILAEMEPGMVPAEAFPAQSVPPTTPAATPPPAAIPAPAPQQVSSPAPQQVSAPAPAAEQAAPVPVPAPDPALEPTTAPATETETLY